MRSNDLLKRFKKDIMQSQEIAERNFEENIIDYAKDKAITLLMLSGMKHCDAGYLVKQHKRIF
jgi:hypothetical protein